MVDCIRPEPNKTIADPACGTGGFFLAAHDFLNNLENYKLNKAQKRFLKFNTFAGNEIVASTRRLCLMNMFLHNIGNIDGAVPVSASDALIADSGERYDYVLANPPFGKKSTTTITNSDGEEEKEDFTYNHQDFFTTTSNKQLNFVQHIRTLLKSTGLHTILRLPTGIFYANGVKANVLFFDNHPARKDPWTKEVWFYDYRTNIHHTLKKKPRTRTHLQAFVDCYSPQNRHERKETWHLETHPEGRWRKYSYDEIIVRDKTSLDIFWLKDKSLADLEKLPDPDVLAEQIIESLEAGLGSFRDVLAALQA